MNWTSYCDDENENNCDGDNHDVNNSISLFIITVMLHFKEYIRIVTVTTTTTLILILMITMTLVMMIIKMTVMMVMIMMVLLMITFDKTMIAMVMMIIR